MITAARILLTVTVGLALVMPSAAAARKPKYGVFGKINGKKFKARSLPSSGVSCVFANYEILGGLELTAGECKGKRHDVPRGDFAQVVFTCGAVPPPKTPPFEAACSSTVYAEAKVKGEQASDLKVWIGSVSPVEGPDGLPVAQNSVHVRIDSFDGLYVKGVFWGTFDVPQTHGLPAAPVTGEVRFFVPVDDVR